MRKCQEPSLHVLDCIASMRCRVNARGGITYLGAKALKDEDSIWFDGRGSKREHDDFGRQHDAWNRHEEENNTLMRQ